MSAVEWEDVMPLSPEEIESKDFIIAMRGYDKQEVLTFLRTVAADYREALGRPGDGGSARAAGTSGADVYDRAGEAISEALRSAGQAALEMQRRAEDEAKEIVERAKRDVQSRLTSADETLEKAKREAAKLREQAQNDAEAFTRQADRDARARVEALREALERALESELEKMRKPTSTSSMSGPPQLVLGPSGRGGASKAGDTRPGEQRAVLSRPGGEAPAGKDKEGAGSQDTDAHPAVQETAPPRN